MDLDRRIFHSSYSRKYAEHRKLWLHRVLVRNDQGDHHRGIPDSGRAASFGLGFSSHRPHPFHSALCNLSFTARMLFSLARGGFAPALLGKLSKNGMPVAAVLASSVGMALALVLAQIFERTAFVFLIGVAFFGGPFIWLMTLATHIAFRLRIVKENRSIARIAPLGIWSSIFGILALLAVLVSTWWIPDFHVALLSGPPWLVFLTACYFIGRKFQSPKSAAGAAPHG